MIMSGCKMESSVASGLVRAVHKLLVCLKEQYLMEISNTSLLLLPYMQIGQAATCSPIFPLFQCPLIVQLVSAIAGTDQPFQERPDTVACAQCGKSCERSHDAHVLAHLLPAFSILFRLLLSTKS